MLNPAFLLIPLIAAAPPVRPAEGDYKLLHDSVSTTKLAWSKECGRTGAPASTSKGTMFKLAHVGDTGFVVNGGTRRFGTRVCEGTNPTLKPKEARSDEKEWSLSCESGRVVDGTETTEHTFRADKTGRVQMSSRIERYQRLAKKQCRVVIERKTVLLSYEEPPPAAPMAPLAIAPAAPPSVAVATAPAAAGAAPAAAAPTPKAKTAPARRSRRTAAAEEMDIEAMLEAELKRAMRETALGTVQVVHENKMGKDFRILESLYTLDGKELELAAAQGNLKEVFNDLLTEGSHVLEIQLVVQANKNGNMVKMTLRDAVFFDVKGETPLRVRVVTYEKTGIFVDFLERPNIRFDLNGKKYRR